MAASSASHVLVTGGCGYLGVPVVDELLRAGSRVRVVDALLHSQESLAETIEQRGVQFVRGDLREPDVRQTAIDGIDAIVHLAAIVGDPACARDPDGSRSVNVSATLALAREAATAGVGRFVFASTCSNYGRMRDPTVPIDENGALQPVSLYAEQKVEVERALLGAASGDMLVTCLRFATLYGVAPRMRFDLTVNEFTRDLWAGRDLEVFGEQFWRPYVHVSDAALAVRTVLGAPRHKVAGEVFNVGNTDQNFRKADLVEIIRRHTRSGRVISVERREDPRDYRVSFEKIERSLGYATQASVQQGIPEIIRSLDEERFGDPFAEAYRNTP
jgi:nucleoside-diphosphate-sugar epimerase